MDKAILLLFCSISGFLYLVFITQSTPLSCPWQWWAGSSTGSLRGIAAGNCCGGCRRCRGDILHDWLPKTGTAFSMATTAAVCAKLGSAGMPAGMDKGAAIGGLVGSGH